MPPSPRLPSRHAFTHKINFACATALLVLAVSTGGSSQIQGAGVLFLQLASLPCIAWVAWQRLQGQSPAWPWPWTALVVALLAIPLLQILPVPAALAGWGEGRAALQADLAEFGAPAAGRISLAPDATLAALYMLLPALAVFGLTLALPRRGQQVLAWVIVGLAMASLLLGVVLLGSPAESPLNPWPHSGPSIRGFMANPNHQATLLLVAAVLAGSWLAAAPARRADGERTHAGAVAAAIAVVVMAVVALPLTGSRAGGVLLILAAATVVAMGRVSARRLGKRGMALLGATAAVAAFGLFAALRWMRVDAVDEMRATLRDHTLDLASAHAPLGSGMGSFVQVFEQSTGGELSVHGYINHAHSEYAQWLLEAGLPALVAMALCAIALAASARALWRLPAHLRSPGLPALIALLAILGHSLVDYPLRTPALLVIAAALAGMLGAAVLRDNAAHRSREAGTARAATSAGEN